jgi:hypothetical protein
MTQNDTPAGRRNLVAVGGTLLTWIPSLANQNYQRFLIKKA